MAKSKITAKKKGPAAKKRPAIKPAKKGSARAAKESAALKRADNAFKKGGGGRSTGINSSTFGGG